VIENLKKPFFIFHFGDMSPVKKKKKMLLPTQVET